MKVIEFELPLIIVCFVALLILLGAIELTSRLIELCNRPDFTKGGQVLYSCPSCGHEVSNADWDERCPECDARFF